MDVITFLKLSLEKKRRLRKLNFSGIDLAALSLETQKAFINAIGDCINLTEIDLSFCNLRNWHPRNFQRLSRIFSRPYNLKFIDFEGNQLENTDEA